MGYSFGGPDFRSIVPHKSIPRSGFNLHLLLERLGNIHLDPDAHETPRKTIKVVINICFYERANEGPNHLRCLLGLHARGNVVRLNPEIGRRKVNGVGRNFGFDSFEEEKVLIIGPGAIEAMVSFKWLKREGLSERSLASRMKGVSISRPDEVGAALLSSMGNSYSSSSSSKERGEYSSDKSIGCLLLKAMFRLRSSPSYRLNLETDINEERTTATHGSELMIMIHEKTQLKYMTVLKDSSDFFNFCSVVILAEARAEEEEDILASTVPTVAATIHALLPELILLRSTSIYQNSKLNLLEMMDRMDDLKVFGSYVWYDTGLGSALILNRKNKVGEA
nr:hypothetical protein Iba_chr01dCG10020 [Ipomoea batatas]